MTDERLSHRHFLVVDDEEFLRRTVRRYLLQSGAAGVEVASDGMAAIELIKNHDMVFDCVITDFQMQPVNGLELLQSIRSGAYGLKRNTPVLLLTTFADSALVAAALALDADGFVVKPVAREALVDRIYRVIRRRMPIRDAASYREAPAFRPGAQTDVNADDEPEPPPESRAPPRAVIPSFSAKKKPPAPADAARSAGSASEDAAETEQKKMRSVPVPLDDVQPNSILAQNVYAGDKKTLLLGTATVLSVSLLNRLKDLRTIHPNLDTILVAEPVE